MIVPEGMFRGGTMSGALLHYHHANLSARRTPRTANDRDTWSVRRKLFCLLACGFGSWMLVLTPFLILT